MDYTLIVKQQVIRVCRWNLPVMVQVDTRYLKQVWQI